MFMTDREIFTGLRQNDRATVAYVYKTLAPALFKYVLSNSGTREDARDLFQETYIKVLKKIQDNKYSHQDKFEAYFFTVARNTWVDWLRDRKQRPMATDATLLLQRADEADEEALCRLMAHDQRIDALQRCWESWADTDCRRILHAFHYEQVRTKDLAQAEETSQNTLLQRLFKCRTKLFRLVSQQLEKTTAI